MLHSPKRNCFLTLLLIILISTSCNKTPEQPNKPASRFAGAYVSDGTTYLGTPVMYTSTGKITDEAIIREFITRRMFGERLDTIITPDVSSEATKWTLSITFDSDTAGHFKGGHPWYWLDSPFNVVAASDSLLLIQGPDSAGYYFNPTISDPAKFHDGQVMPWLIGREKPEPQCTTLDAADGDGQICTYLPVFPINIRNGDLYVPTLAYVYRSRFDSLSGNVYTYANADWKRIDPNLRALLWATDTVVVQPKEHKLIKQ